MHMTIHLFALSMSFIYGLVDQLSTNKFNFIHEFREVPALKNVASRIKLLDNFMQRQQMGTVWSKNEIDKYLEEESFNLMITSFHVLCWWKENSTRCKTLSLIAKDVLAISVSTVASEYAFSINGRILDPF